MNIQEIAVRHAPHMLSILRIVAGLLFLEHGTSRLFGWPSPLPSPAVFSMYWFAGAIELVGGALLVLGLFTRLRAFFRSSIAVTLRSSIASSFSTSRLPAPVRGASTA